MPSAVVQVKNIGLAKFQQAFFAEEHPVSQRRCDNHPAVDHLDFDPGAVADVLRPVVRHIQIQCSISVDVSQGQRGAAEFGFRAGAPGHVPEFSMTVILEAEDTMSQRGN